MSNGHAQTIRRGLEAFNARDFETAINLLTEDVVWASFLSRTQGEYLHGRDEVRAAWESQVDVLDLRAEALEYISVGSDKVVVPMRMMGRGRGSEMTIAASIVWLWTLGPDGLGTSVEVFDEREAALEAAGAPEAMAELSV